MPNGYFLHLLSHLPLPVPLPRQPLATPPTASQLLPPPQSQKQPTARIHKMFLARPFLPPPNSTCPVTRNLASSTRTGRKLRQHSSGRQGRRQRIGRSLVRNSTYEVDDVGTEKSAMRKDSRNQIQSSFAWKFVVYGTTFLLPTCILKRILGTRDWKVCYAWREKFAWCFVIMVLCLSVAFLTFGFTTPVCDNSKSIYTYSFFTKTTVEKKDQWFLAHGRIFSPFSKRNRLPIVAADYEPFIGLDVSDSFTLPAVKKLTITMIFRAR